MAATSKIEWTDASFNPIRARNRVTGKVGWFCVHASGGCINCYAEVLNRRVGTGIDYKAQNASQVELFLDERTLLAPLKWKPRKIFVGSMTDLFGEFVPDEMIDRMFAVMALCPQHTFQVLTKRAERMREYVAECQGNVWDETTTFHRPNRVSLNAAGQPVANAMPPWPLPNVWLGVSCEDQANADARIPHLLATPAAVRFLSCEPLLEPIDLTNAVHVMAGEMWNYLTGSRGESVGADEDGRAMFLGPGDEHLGYDGPPKGPGIDWVICGGESGPHARPFNTEWAKSIVDQSSAAGVACFVKQLGAYVIQGGERRIKRDRKGGDISEFPHDIRIREFPNAA